MDVEALFSGHYGADVGASPYPVCPSLPAISGIKGTNGAVVRKNSILTALDDIYFS